MNVQVSVTKDGEMVAGDVVFNPQTGGLEDAIRRVLRDARKAVDGPLWDCQIDIRQVE